MRRGDISCAQISVPIGKRPVVLISRAEAYAIKARVTVVAYPHRSRHSDRGSRRPSEEFAHVAPPRAT
jgi:mRNA-degrading endonuclease toxin of MazEF toxin-antitoxin module